MISLQYLLGFLSIIISSGVIGYTVRLVIKIEVLERLVNDAKDERETLFSKQTTNESDIKRLQDGMGRIESSLERVTRTCEMLPSIDARLGTILEKVGQFVPRDVIDGKLDNIRVLVDSNKEEIKFLKGANELNKRKPPSNEI